MQVNYGAGLESDQHLHLSAHGPYDDAGSSTQGPAYSPFRHPAVPAIDPTLDASAGASRNGHAPMSSLHQNPNHLLQPDNASLAGQHLPHSYYPDMSRSSQTPSTPSNASPRFPAVSPHSQPKQIASSFVPSDRALPSRHVSDDTIDDAYAAFILYCNPSFRIGIDTTELTKLFRMPPKSDGNAFSTWRLFELIRKLELKEIPTWTQLALDLGVEKPDFDKGQSTQKVQQYSVRLKRWMRAMHIDAFFEYLLGKHHPYFVHIPPPETPFPDGGRDGVALEEDLAIRALDARFRPKRGRRRADEGDDDMEAVEGTPPRKRPQLDTSIPFGNVIQPQSAYPSSAHPDHMEGFPTHDPWPTSAMTSSSALTAASTASSRLHANKNLTPYSASPMSSQVRWRVNPHDNPSTPHPLSAVTPMSAHSDYFDEPQSAVTPSTSKARSRRRHGPAVSSAWPSNTSSSTGKLRGRPPSNRSVRDGPFVTFPANPKTKEGPTIDMARNPNPGNLTPIVERSANSESHSTGGEQHQQQQFRFPPTPASAVSQQALDSPLHNSGQKPKAHRLSLQVPPNVGNPVRLVTPTVLVNGSEQDTASSISAHSHYYSEHAANVHPTPMSAPVGRLGGPNTPGGPFALPRAQSQPQSAVPPTSEVPVVSVETLNRALAAEIIRAPLSGRKKRLRSAEAKSLAAAILQPLYSQSSSTHSSSQSKAMNDYILGIVISSCLGLCAAVGLGSGGPSGGVRRVECTRFRVGGDGYESPVDEDEVEDGDAVEREGNRHGEEGEGEGKIKESFHVFFEVGFGGLSGEWSVKDLSLAVDDDGGRGERGGVEDDERPDEGQNSAADAAHWKAKFLDMQRKVQDSREREKALRDKVLEAVL